jgi:hypothetical protein
MAREEYLASDNCLRLLKLAVVNAFLCSPAMAPENSLDNTKQRRQLVGTPSAECYSKSKFPHEETQGLYRTLGEQSKKLSSFFFKQPAKQLSCLVSPTPPSGCQHKGVNVSKKKYEMQ